MAGNAGRFLPVHSETKIPMLSNGQVFSVCQHYSDLWTQRLTTWAHLEKHINWIVWNTVENVGHIPIIPLSLDQLRGEVWQAIPEFGGKSCWPLCWNILDISWFFRFILLTPIKAKLVSSMQDTQAKYNGQIGTPHLMTTFVTTIINQRNRWKCILPIYSQFHPILKFKLIHAPPQLLLPLLFILLHFHSLPFSYSSADEPSSPPCSFPTRTHHFLMQSRCHT